jgi:transposase
VVNIKLRAEEEIEMQELTGMKVKREHVENGLTVGGGLERNEASRSEATNSESPPPTVTMKRPSQEVEQKPVRRKYTAEYKLKILKEADRCKDPGQIGALLRREGLYSSNLTAWRKQRDRGALDGLKGKKRGPKKEAPNPLAGEVQRLSKENKRMEKRLKKAEAIIEFQKKIAEILEIPMKSPGSEGDD